MNLTVTRVIVRVQFERRGRFLLSAWSFRDRFKLLMKQSEDLTSKIRGLSLSLSRQSKCVKLTNQELLHCSVKNRG